jgi:hypothetical protein
MHKVTRSDWEDDFNSEAEYLVYLKTAADEVMRLSQQGPVTVDPDVADYMGAFEDDSLDIADILLSNEIPEENEDDN